MMMKSEKMLAELTAFENILDTFGGDPARWPAEKRAGLESLARTDADGARLLREARALDAVLTHASGPPVGNTSVLADRIAAAVANTAPGQSGAHLARAQDTGTSTFNAPGVVIAWPRGSANARAAAAALAGVTPTPYRNRMTNGWRTAALLAASLVVGVFVGTTDLLPGDVAQFVASATTGTDNSAQALAFLSGEGLLEMIDEEFL